MTIKTTSSTADKAKLGAAGAVVILAIAFAAYTLWGGPRPGQAEPATGAPPEPAVAPTAPSAATKPADAPAAAAAPAEKPSPHKVGGRMVPTDAKPGGN